MAGADMDAHARVCYMYTIPSEVLQSARLMGSGGCARDHCLDGIHRGKFGKVWGGELSAHRVEGGGIFPKRRRPPKRVG